MCALLVAAPAFAYTRERVALVIENAASNPAAASDVAPILQDLLRRKRYEVISGQDLSEALTPDRSGSVAPDVARAVAKNLGADAIVTVTVSFYLDAQDRPRGPRASPAIGMLASMTAADGRLRWRNSLAMIVDEAASLNRTRTMVTRGSSRRVRVAPPAASMVAGAGAPAPAAPAEPVLLQKSAAVRVCEQLLWTLPRGRPSPEEIEAMRAPARPAAPPVEPQKATRFEQSPDRLRESPGVARFPMKVDRKQQQ